MIAIHLEPKGLKPDTPPLIDDYLLVSRADATRGSAMLRNAILRCMGLPAANDSSVSKKTIQAMRSLECCEKCGSPLKPVSGIVKHIQATVCGYYGLHPSSMTTARRGFDVAHPRQIAMYFAAELTPKSLPEIGRRFGGRDHTTVIHAIKAVRSRIATDPEVAEDVRILRAVLAPEAIAA